jgi:hypothetical protein
LSDLNINDVDGSTLWERAAVANPGEKELTDSWLDDAISRSDWKGAQKV